MSASARLLRILLLAAALAVLPFVAAQAKPGNNNRGGSDRSHEVRQNGDNDNGGGNRGGNSGGTGTPDAGDNRHPSGNDKSVETGGSYPQGHSTSDPDGMSNGGADKPGGTGGIDQGDQDGNNGCGNDDDFEDDNNGNCGGLHKGSDEGNAVIGGEVEEPAEIEEPAGVGGGRGAAGGRAVIVEPVFFAGGGETAGAVVEPVGTEIEPATAVLASGEAVDLAKVREFGTGTLSAINGVLPRTGGGIATLALSGLGLIGAGTAMRLTRRRSVAL